MKSNYALSRLMRAVGSAAEKQRLTNWHATTPRMKAVLSAVVEWTETVKERMRLGEGLVLYGPVGTGKDHLAFGAIGKAMHDNQLTGEWVNCRRWFSKLRDSFDNKTDELELMAELTRPDLAVISDPLPVSGSLTAYQADMLYQVIDSRRSNGRPTIVTINVADDAEADAKLGAATWDRVCDRAWKVFCNWPSHRQPSRVI